MNDSAGLRSSAAETRNAWFEPREFTTLKQKQSLGRQSQVRISGDTTIENIPSIDLDKIENILSI